VIVATVFAALVLLSGYGVVRLLGLAKGATTLGVAPACGLALLAVITTWSGMMDVPAPAAGGLVALCSVVGLGLAIADREALAASLRALAREHRLALTLLVAAVLVPFVSMGVAFAQVQAPLSPHDGAFHVETSNAFRQVTAVANWYPPGVAALFGGVLQLMPWVDTAYGAYALGLGLTLLTPLAAFGLGAAIWRNLIAATTGALLLSLTHLLGYYPQIWSGWPQLMGILLVIGVWLVGLAYLEQPGWRWPLLAGLLIGGIVLVHGTELYTTAIVLATVCIANWRRIDWLRLLSRLGGTVVLAVICAAPYLPVLLHWAGGGGAYAAGNEDGTALEQGTASAVQLLGLFAVDALGVDFPVHIVLLVLGIVWAVRWRVGLTVVAVTFIFVALAVIATLFNGVPIVRSVFAATYPWSLPYRHLTFAALGFALLGGAGGVLLIDIWARLRSHFRAVRMPRVLGRLGRLLVVTWVLVSTGLLTLLLSIEAGGDVSFTADDAAAMAWLRSHASASDVVVNDTFADAGIWAPYKAGVRILFYRSVDDPATAAARQLVLQNVGRLGEVPEAAAADCSLGADYVYYGAANAAWQVRSFPPLEELRRSASLETVFEQGEATVFRVKLNC
jgi:uncharacterized protein DUF6541